MDMSFFALDCFHMNTYGHRAFAVALWNNMVRVIYPIGLAAGDLIGRQSKPVPNTEYLPTIKLFLIIKQTDPAKFQNFSSAIALQLLLDADNYSNPLCFVC